MTMNLSGQEQNLFDEYGAEVHNEGELSAQSICELQALGQSHEAYDPEGLPAFLASVRQLGLSAVVMQGISQIFG